MVVLFFNMAWLNKGESEDTGSNFLPIWSQSEGNIPLLLFSNPPKLFRVSALRPTKGIWTFSNSVTTQTKPDIHGITNNYFGRGIFYLWFILLILAFSY